jgi:hypothetical protein
MTSTYPNGDELPGGRAGVLHSDGFTFDTDPDGAHQAGPERGRGASSEPTPAPIAQVVRLSAFGRLVAQCGSRLPVGTPSAVQLSGDVRPPILLLFSVR